MKWRNAYDLMRGLLLVGVIVVAEYVSAQDLSSTRIDVSSKRINELQLVGTHNSYHLAPDKVAMELIQAAVPSEARSLDNSQRTLPEQFELLGVRHIELDVYLDPDGKLYQKPVAYRMAQQQKADVPEYDPAGKMSKPGIKVLHSPDFDFRTTVYTLRDALAELKKWSDGNRRHVPVFVLVELKSDSFSPLTRPVPWNEEGFKELEREVYATFSRERILTPDDLRGDQATLREAVQGVGWPRVDEQRGKVCFLLDNEGSVRDAYLQPSEILENRLLFVSVDRNHPAAAWMKRNDPVGGFAEIRALVDEGFLVRTRADSGTIEARNNDDSRLRKAISSGAQLISTDFPEADKRFSDYRVSLPLPIE
jgi:hypothetical protein